MTFEILGYAFIGGLLPALVWLYFLLTEDSRCPEPRPVIMFAFVVGMISVYFAIAPEQFARERLSGEFPVILSWALIEEVLKYIAAAVFILWRSAVDETPDYVIYMLTVALGFAAAENMLFLIGPLTGTGDASALVTNNLRFLGSTLLHVIASSAIGFAFALSYSRGPLIRIVCGSLGLILAVVLHTAFNLLIIRHSGTQALSAFFLVWTMAVVFFAAFEILKYFRYRNVPKNVC